MANTKSPDKKQAPLIEEVLARVVWGQFPESGPQWAAEAITELRAAGYAIVPVEASEAMIEASGIFMDSRAAEVWRAMIESFERYVP